MSKLIITSKYIGQGHYNCSLCIKIEGDANTIEYTTPRNFAIAKYIDENNITEIKTNKEYLYELAVNSYLGKEFTYDYTVDEAIRYCDNSYSSKIVGNIFSIYDVINHNIYRVPAFNSNGNPFNYSLNSYKYIRYAKTLLKNIENNFEFLKEMDNKFERGYGYQPYSSLLNTMTSALIFAAQDNNITNKEIDRYIDIIESLYSLTTDTYSISNPLSLIVGSEVYPYRLKNVQLFEFKLNKYAISKLINLDIKSALKLKSKCQVTKLDMIMLSMIQNCLPLTDFNTANDCRYYANPEVGEKLIKNANSSLIDFSIIENLDKFVNLVVSKNLKRNKAHIIFYFAQAVCKDIFPWDKFNTERILSVLPDMPNTEEKCEDIPLNHMKYIMRFANTNEKDIITAFTYLNMLSSEDLDKYLDKITYQLFKGITSYSCVDKLCDALKTSIYAETNIHDKYWRWKINITEDTMINSDNIKRVFVNLIEYYDGYANKANFKKLIHIINNVFPIGFIDTSVSKKYRKISMEMKIGD